MAIVDVDVPQSDGWWLKRLYEQLRLQQKRCGALQKRYEGDSPLPFVSDIQADAVRWFVQKSRTNWERLIVQAPLSRLRIVGIRTATDAGEGGDAKAYALWEKAHGKLVALDAHKMAFTMSMSFVIVGVDDDGEILVTAEDPRLVTAITDPANPYKVLAALKLFHDDVADEDVAYLYLPGRVEVARRPRKVFNTSTDVRFNPRAYTWDRDLVDAAGVAVYDTSGAIENLASFDAEGKLIGGSVPVVPFVNEDGMAEFEPFLNQIDRINQQILQRMTIATVQAFKQRAFKGLPEKDPATGEKIDYNAIFVADPGAIWSIPAAAEIWESGVVDLTPILMAIRDDVRDLAATSGTPLYAITPDAANGSAEGASLQRETLTFKVEVHQDRFEPSHAEVDRLIFLMAGDKERAVPGTIKPIWAPAERYSMSERANAIAQTAGVLSRYQQATAIWGMTPDQATRNASELTQDMILDQQYAVAAQPPARQLPPDASGAPQPKAGQGATGG